MTEEDFSKVVERCRIGGALPIAFGIRPRSHRSDDLVVVMFMSVPDVTKPGNPLIEVIQTRLVSLYMMSTEKDVIRFLASIATDFYRHELHEWFLIGEERPLVPHAEHA